MYSCHFTAAFVVISVLSKVGVLRSFVRSYCGILISCTRVHVRTMFTVIKNKYSILVPTTIIPTTLDPSSQFKLQLCRSLPPIPSPSYQIFEELSRYLTLNHETILVRTRTKNTITDPPANNKSPSRHRLLKIKTRETTSHKDCRTNLDVRYSSLLTGVFSPAATPRRI